MVNQKQNRRGNPAGNTGNRRRHDKSDRSDRGYNRKDQAEKEASKFDNQSDKLRQWKRLLSYYQERPPQTRNYDRFFPFALELIETDLGTCQTVVNTLTKDDGLAFISQLARVHIPLVTQGPLPEQQRVWACVLEPFFKIITKPQVARSPMLEQDLAAICNYTLGIQGERAKVILRHVVQFFMELSETTPTTVNSHGKRVALMDSIALTCAFLASIVYCNSSTVGMEFLSTICIQIEALIEKDHNVQASAYARENAKRDLAYVRRRIGGSVELAPEKLSQTISEKPVFHLYQDGPGFLSTKGPRHDNDHEHIENIKILPTRDEISATRDEYLPTTDTTTFLRSGIHGRLDREFRLLREDTIGLLRDAVRAYISHKQKNADLRTEPQPKSKDGLRTYTYANLTVVDIQVKANRGMEFVFRFDQIMKGVNRRDREDKWGRSKRLHPGGLVCVIDHTDKPLFFTVSDTTSRDTKQRSQDWNQKQLQSDNETVYSLSHYADDAYIVLELVDETYETISQVIKWQDPLQFRRTKKFRGQLKMVEFPGVLLPSFQHTLSALQIMCRNPRIPFVDFIAPRKEDMLDQSSTVPIPLPQYALKPGFTYNLQCVLKKGENFLFSPHHDPEERYEELSEKSTLDLTQARAILHMLTRQLALVQGPPGTGKSYTGEKLIQILLANKSLIQPGPIICVCYTNHALDQLLMHLLDNGIDRIIRVGSRSASERLQNLNLRIIARGMDQTKAERQRAWRIREGQKEAATEVDIGLKKLTKQSSIRALTSYLEDKYPTNYAQIFRGVDDEGFVLAGGKTASQKPPDPKVMLRKWLSEGSGSPPDPMPTIYQLLGTKNVLHLPNYSRRALHRLWMQAVETEHVKEVTQSYKELIETKKRIDRVNREIDVRCLQNADIIGITTTGLARNIELFQCLTSKIMVCEEAGEVLESHTLTALLPSVEHAILIGDHLQLRPQIQNDRLKSSNRSGNKYSLDCSLFQRLVLPPNEGDLKIPFCTLETQRRMHPSISNLIRKTLYPSLVDGGDVHSYPEVAGMRKRLFWLDHNHLEDGAGVDEAVTTSRSNHFEADFVVGLTRHLVRQGTYQANDIAIITPYLGQLFLLRKKFQNLFEVSLGDRDVDELEKMQGELEVQAEVEDHSTVGAQNVQYYKRNLLESIRLATVDNFQGEEAKVIVVSLVRCNAQKRCGFLSTSNRINVLLSRAQHGMYIIGNVATYESVDMWQAVIGQLTTDGNLGPEMELQCPRHQETPMKVSTVDHFLQYSPEGGCLLPCTKRLRCGHACTSRCHASSLHDTVHCTEVCTRPRKDCAKHPCNKDCGDRCEDKCSVILDGEEITLKCGHAFRNPKCYQTRSSNDIKCRVKVTHELPGCGHRQEHFCHIDVSGDGYRCTSRCGSQLPCGHICNNKCFECRPKKKGGVIVKEDHGECRLACGKRYGSCRHDCRLNCHPLSDCPPCPAKCESQCSHSKCDKYCHEPCPPCAERVCASSCQHQTCTMPCAAPCNWIPCSLRCDELLECGHQCPSICGEACPPKKFCQVCGPSEIGEAIVDFVMFETYSQINLDENPCVFLACGHFFTMQNLDGIMDLRKYYVMEGYGEGYERPVKLLTDITPFSGEKIQPCPTCRGSMRNIGRYGRMIRRVMLDEATKRFITWAQTRQKELEAKFLKTRDHVSREASLKKAVNPRKTQSTKIDEGRRKKRRVCLSPRLEVLLEMAELETTKKLNGFVKLWQEIYEFVEQTSKEEQPLVRVNNLVRYALRNDLLDLKKDEKNDAENHIQSGDDMVQMGPGLRANMLLFHCETSFLGYVLKLHRNGWLELNKNSRITLAEQQKECYKMLEQSRKSHFPKVEAEAYIRIAEFKLAQLQFWRLTFDDYNEMDVHSFLEGGVRADGMTMRYVSKANAREDMWEEVGRMLDQAEAILEQYSGMDVLIEDIARLRRMLREQDFYDEVTEEEKRMIAQAMRQDSHGAVTWYQCINGHPFTIGECGRPMQLARCSECGEPVGGQEHVLVEGVSRLQL